MTEAIIRLSGVYKHYLIGEEKTSILHGIDLSIARGEMAVIRGMSGSGKTTLLNIIGGLDTVDAGEAIVAGHPLHRLNFKEMTRFRAENLGFIFQFHNLIPTLSVMENVLSGLEAMRPLKHADEQLALHYLTQVGLAGHENKFPNRLSGGQQQRVAIARALIKHPAVILADEPTGSLDEETGRTVMQLLRQLQTEQKTTVVMVTHNPELSRYANHVYEMRSGHLQTHTLQALEPV
ncbi:ABC transporter ATP-binding protein [Chromobacterium sphagni]|uniref:ABC transporter domain-containing protein n=1 Tax=Chromobacterium sphagni TaxID=1903179 RepID=A0A1S1X2P1_9NEIS|nr:ABC transporter ATP-binding protein [Chromobacterium sphagni]OHX13486.1 hypothetical protein BI347_08145 [Chromobacterium sphagni]OHX21942.1 hypothetical protein BI344_05435 [Chromobacterium sphagni]